MERCSARLLERERAVLVVVDMQDRLAAVMPRRDVVVARAALLARAAELLEVPVVVTRQYQKGLGDTVDDLAILLTHALTIDKMTFCCMGEPSFVRVLERLGRAQVVLAGMETHICVTQTALALLDSGYAPHVVADACCSRHDADHDGALMRLAAEGVIVTRAESAIYEMTGRAGTQEFRDVLSLVKAAEG
ncbi:MAG: hydrolase [Coriobacteriia bacterium]